MGDRANTPEGRLVPGPTCRVDFSRPLDFTFLGRPVRGFAGDTVASALYAARVRVFGRSLKYHRPRGLHSMDGESSNTLMRIDGVPNECAETTALRAGMSVSAQNVRGDPRRDVFGFIDAFDRMMPAGFYYRVGHRPRRAWPLFRDGLRRMAGTGVLDPRRGLGRGGGVVGGKVAVAGNRAASGNRAGGGSRPGRGKRARGAKRARNANRARSGLRAERYLNADVAVVGGGAGGMAAALAAAESGLRVCLFERRPWLGGHLAWRVREFESEALYRRGERLAARLLRARSRSAGIVKIFTNSPVTGVWGENLLTGFTIGTDDDGFRECHWECRAKAVVIAAGCMDRPLVFTHNDRPGVMQVQTAWRLARTYAVRPGKAAVFSVGDDLGLEAALDLADLGVAIAAVADAREAGGQDCALLEGLGDRGIEVLPGWAASRVMGRKGVRGIEVRSLNGGGGRRLRGDLLVANAGAQPRIGTLASAGARLAYCTRTHGYQPVELPRDVFVAGSMTGLRDPRAIEASGRLAGHRAAGSVAADAAQRDLRSLPGPPAGCGIAHGPGIGRGAKAFVDLDEDGTCKNVAESVRQGFDVPELAKRFGGFGLGPGQYRIAGQNLAMIMARMRGDPVEAALPTTVRPPLSPPSLATLAGPNHDVRKRTPLHGELAARGAIFRRAGAWERARYFTEDRTCRDEIRNVRRNVGVLDSSPLGKFRVFGPDALRALQRVYISDMRKARPGRCLYSAMCNDMGHLMDDGVVVGEGENDYYFTTSSGRAGSTVEWFRYHTRHDGWDFNLVNLTDVLGSLNLAGPNARRVLERVTGDDVSNGAFPYLGCRRITVGDGVETRCLRLGFVGELSFELHVPSSYCKYVWDMLLEAGADLGIQPFGLEAQYCLRAEKGHVIIGAESEARVTLTDIGMGWLWDREDTGSRKVGAPALRACEKQPGRMKLVGFRVDKDGGGGGGRGRGGGRGVGRRSGGGGGDRGPGPGTRSPRDGALVVDGDEIEGYVCTTRRSEALGWRYGMALVRDGVAVEGDRIEIRQEEKPSRRVSCTATVVPMPFYDPEGTRPRA